MTAPATTSSAQAAPANGNQTTRQSSESSAASRNGRGRPIDLFANLLGLISATRDDATPLTGVGLPGDGKAGTADAEDPTDLLPEDPNAALLGQANPAINPLADLIGWPGAAAFAAASGAGGSSTNAHGVAGSLPQGASKDAGLSLQGMTVLAQPGSADPGLVPDAKTQSTPASAAANSDAVSVRYSDTPVSPNESNTETAASTPSRNHPADRAARPANWRSTTTLAPAGAAGATAKLAGAPTQTVAIQQAQNAVAQRGPVDGSSLAAARPSMPLGERFGEATIAEAAASDLITPGGPGQASKEQTGSSGGEREASMSMGASAAERLDTDTTDEAFSLDAALAAEEELDGTEFLTPNALRHASVRVGEGTDQAIDIKLSLDGDAVNVDFRTDNAEVRAGLQNNAGASLSDLMQRGGIQLGGVSVGAQSQHSRGQSEQGDSAPSRSSAATGRIPSSAGTSGSSGPDLRARTPITRRSDGGPALDIFA